MRKIYLLTTIMLFCIFMSRAEISLVVESGEEFYRYEFSEKLSYNVNNDVLTIFSDSNYNAQFIIEGIVKIYYTVEDASNSPEVEHDKLKIDIQGKNLIITGGNEESVCRIYSSNGVLVFSAPLQNGIVVDFKDFDKGVYVVNIENFKSFKFLLQ